MSSSISHDIRDITSLYPHNSGYIVVLNRGDGVYPMQGETRERWQKLCEQAVVEQDPDKLMELIRQINRLLDEKENRLKQRAGRT
jgi:hypothetical protein